MTMMRWRNTKDDGATDPCDVRGISSRHFGFRSKLFGKHGRMSNMYMEHVRHIRIRNKQISRHHPQPRWKHAERMAIWSQFCSLEKKYVIRLIYRSFASIMRIVNDEQRRFQTKVIRLTLTCRFILLRSDIAVRHKRMLIG